MTKRRIPLLLIVLLAIAGTVVVSREVLCAERPVFSTAAVGWMPSAPPEQGLTETWFCPGVPATGVDDVGGAIVIANRTADRARRARSSCSTSSRENRRLDLAVDGWSMATVDLDATLAGPDGGRGRRGRGRRSAGRAAGIRSPAATAARRAPTPRPTRGTSPTGSPSTAASTRSCSPTRTTRRSSHRSSSPRARARARPGRTAA